MSSSGAQRLTPQARQELEAILPDPDRLQIDRIDSRYQTDSQQQLHARADAVARVCSRQEVSDLLAWASRHQIPVTPRGAGTNLTGSTLPVLGGLVIDLSGMDRILSLDEKTMTVEVEPGVRLDQLQAYVEERGFFYPPDPGEKKATIAGNIATNAGGMRAVKYGVTRDYVRQLEVVLAGGRTVELGSLTVKDASGLALKEALIGSEGTLGIITRARLKILPRPACSSSVLVGFRDLKESAACVQRILRSPLQPTALEFMNRSVVEIGEDFCHLRYPCPQAGSYLLLTFDGSKDAVSRDLDALEELVRENGALETIRLEDPKQAADIWRVRGALCTAVESVSIQEPIDIVVPVDRIVDFISRVEEIEVECGLQMVSFGHAGDGNIHLCIVRGNLDDAQWTSRLNQALSALYEKAYACQGLASGEHGIGLQKRRYYLSHSDPTALALMNGIKDAFDPDHLLNASKSYVLDRRSDRFETAAGEEACSDTAAAFQKAVLERGISGA